VFSALPQLDPDVLLERVESLEAIRRAAGTAAGGAGRAVLIEGAAGIGKSALLDAGARLAADAGMQVLRARGAELERDFAFGVVGQLFGHAVRACGGQLSGRAALAASALDLRAVPADSTDTLYAALQGLYWLTVDLTEQAPVALVVDDAHWADPASLRFLVHLVHRIEGIGVLVLTAARPAAGEASSVRALRDAELLKLEPLSLEATAALVRSLRPLINEATARACHAVTGGNAFYVHALVRALAEDPDVDLSTGDWSPDAITRHVGLRLEMVSPDARRLARAMSVLAPGASLRHAATIAGLDMTAATAALDTLGAGDILAAGGPLEFVHPIVRAAVRDGLGSGERANLHRQAARLFSDEGASGEQVAVHLLHCARAGDPWAVSVLHDAARQALGRGAPETAMSYLLRALDEPPRDDARVGLLMDLAEVEGLTFDPGAAAVHLLEAHARASDREQRLVIASRLSVLHSHGAGTGPAIELLAGARRDFVEEPDTVLRIEARMANVGRGDLSGRELSLPVIERLRKAAELSPDDPEVLAAAAAELVMVAEPADRVRDIARKALMGGDGAVEAGAALAQLVAVRVLITVEDFEVAAGALSAALEASRSRGSELSYVFAAVFYADLLLRRGELLNAEAEAHAAYTIAAEHGWPGGLPWLVASMLEVLVQRGRLEEAEQLLAEAGMLAPAAELTDPYTSNVLLAARGRLRAAQERPVAALADLRECGRRQQAWGELNPALIAWRSPAAEVLWELGERDEARDLVLEELALARRFAAPRALGIALRVAARLTDGPEGDVLAEEACQVLTSSPARLEHAYALADLAQRRLAQGSRQQARDLLGQALELADRCGADVLEDRVRTQLRLVGARPRRAQRSGPRSLTPSERQIALLAAHGKPNRQIAEELFVTQRTVEFHLGHAFRKLGIASRRELPDALTGMLDS
jgi:DNA-binding CsgD family transcriptional regulator